MTDERFDNKIRGLMIELVDATPPAPSWESIRAQVDGPAVITDELAGTITHDRDAVTQTPPGRVATTPADVLADDDLPTYAAPTSERRRPRWRPLAAGAGAIGVLAGGAFAYASLVDDDGAATPEAAVEAFVESVAAEDAIGAFESLPPSERTLLLDTAQDLATEAERLGMTESLELSDVEGFDFEVQGLALETEELGDGVVAVHIDGQLVSQSTGAELPLGPAILDNIEDSSLQDFDAAVSDLRRIFAEEDVFVVAIEEDGRWHTSAWYTIAEYIRRADDQPVPSFGTSPVAPLGSESPEAVVRTFVEAMNRGDLNTALALGLPGESRVLYDYVPLFFDEAQAGAAEFEPPSIDRLDLSVSGDGDVRSVRIDAYDFVWTSEDGTSRSAYIDDCVISSFEAAPGNNFGDDYEERMCRDDAIAEGALPLDWDLSTGVQYVTVEQDGRWYLSPVRTIGQSLVDGARQIPDAASATELFEGAGALPFFNRILSLYSGVNYGFFPMSAVTMGGTCFESVDSEGNTFEECSDGGSFEGTGVPVDEDGVPIGVSTTVVGPVTPTTAVQATVPGFTTFPEDSTVPQETTVPPETTGAGSDTTLAPPD
jgi:hypothetical protein